MLLVLFLHLLLESSSSSGSDSLEASPLVSGDVVSGFRHGAPGPHNGNLFLCLHAAGFCLFFTVVVLVCGGNPLVFLLVNVAAFP